MDGVTGIELGPNYCVLVRGGRLGTQRTVSAATSIAPADWPSSRHVVVELLRELRRRHDLSSRARVVAWDGDDAVAVLADAGFEHATVLSPAQALARVVRSRQIAAPPGTAIAALSVNTHGAAIAIVAGTEILHQRVFDWPLGTPFTGARSELLDRYLLVSQLAPQLQHAIELVRPVFGVTVNSIVACGNLPNLRSLSMLLIEELDVEVETLDAQELLEPGAATGTLADDVAALQIAAAVASPAESAVVAEPVAAAEPVAPPDVTDGAFRPARRQTLAAVAAIVFSTAWSVLQIGGASPARPVFSETERAALVAAARAPEPRPEATSGRDEPAVASAEPPLAPNPPLPRRRRAAPLPTVDGIMISGSQRLAIVGGMVVAAGDSVGRREVARIEHDGVILRDPSGREIYVAIRPRKPPSLGS